MTDDAIALVGLAGRFPGAVDAQRFWRNLLDEVDSVRAYTDAELCAAGVEERLLADSRYVRCAGHLDGIAEFDADFFGYPAAEAALIDPQQRMFLEVAWSAMEDAGYDPGTVDGPVGVFTGTSVNRYFLTHLFGNPAAGPVPGNGEPDALMPAGHAADYLPTRTSYKLGLTGPSVAVQAACASSLVAVCLAAQNLLDYRCDLAIAGGASVASTEPAGYLPKDGGLLSADGMVRPFDADARGTVYGSGAGAVILKRLADVTDDTVYAVLRGWAVTNDGADRAGFAAPGVSGLASAVVEALSCAELAASDVSYVEAHGAGTPVGDAIEVRAMSEAYDSAERCLLGSVKSNIGNLDAAAGVASLIKVALSLRHGIIPATLHFRSPHPELGPAGDVFQVAAKTVPWPAGPRIAGVTSIGLGGTSAHIVLAAPDPQPGATPVDSLDTDESSDTDASVGADWQLLQLSARTDEDLAEVAALLAERLAGRDAPALSDVAYTLAVGRRPLPARRAVLARTGTEAITALRRVGGTATPEAAATLAGGTAAPEAAAASVTLAGDAAGPAAAASLAGGIAAPEAAASLAGGAAVVDATAPASLVGLAAAWCAGGAATRPTAGRRVPLPTYPFRRRRHWIQRPEGRS